MGRTKAPKQNGGTKKVTQGKKQTPPSDSVARSRTQKCPPSERVSSTSAKANQATAPITKDHQDHIRHTIYVLISRTRASSTICPSQVPRHLHAAHPDAFPDWRALMQPVRDVAWEEARQGVLEVTQGGEVRQWEKRDEIRGPIRLRRGKNWVDPNDDHDGG